jgi:hypothetical protein
MDCFQWRRTAVAPYPCGRRKVDYTAPVLPRSNGDAMAWSKSVPEVFCSAAAAKLSGVLALALMLGGCDRCGDWFGIPKSQGSGLDACHKEAPSPQQAQ